jgi:hypothetical protein
MKEQGMEQTRLNLLRAVGALSIGGLVLAGCGPTQDAGVGSSDPPVSTVDPGVTGPELVLASPDAAAVPGDAGVETPEVSAIQAEGVEVSIRDGKLDPFSIEAQPGAPVVLIVNGDGTEHTFAIENLVDETTIAAEGQSRVEFSNSEEPGTFEIMIDGEPGGEFKAMDAAGISS